MKILIADDEPELANLLKIHLENQGHEIFTCERGDDAFIKLVEIGLKIDLLILDYKLPVWDGVTVLKQLAEIDKKITTIVLSGYDIEKLEENFEGYSNVFKIITKPFTLKVITAVVEESEAFSVG